MSSTKSSMASQLTEIRQMCAGILKHFAGQSLVLNGTTIKAEDFVSRCEAYEAEVTATAAAEAAWKQLIEAQQKTAASFTTPMMRAARRFVQSAFGPQSATLVDFGMTPARTPVRTVQNKVEALEKSKLTREARHTMGKKQKAAIHGTPAAPETQPAAGAPAAPAPGSSTSPSTAAAAPMTPNATGAKTS